MQDVVYHYTDGYGLAGILDSASLWCTHIAYLNDSLEYKFAKGLYQSLLIKMTEDTTRSEIHRKIASKALDYFEDRLKSESPFEKQQHIFLSSFSTKPDDLSQWRGYSGAGPRFTIGFRTEQLIRLTDMRLEPVRYGDELNVNSLTDGFLQEVDQLRARNAELLKNYPPSQIPPSEFVHFNANIVDAVAPLAKHAKFEDESEYRLHLNWLRVKGSPQQLKFRQGRSFLVPYIAVDLKALDNPIESITVGPTPHPDEARLAVTLLVRASLHRNLVDGIGDRIHLSKVPYRDW
jgi:hypothetical protein